MNRKTILTLLMIASGLMAVAGLIFIGLSIFEGSGNNPYLQAGLVCGLLSNLFNVIREQLKKEK